VIDTHGGRGLYDIGGEEAQKTGEAETGIVRLLAQDRLPGVLEPYGDLVRGLGANLYPGSPLIAAKLLRSQDRLVAIEKHPEDHAALASALSGNARARIIRGDYRRELNRLLPPAERRGLVLIDPPYEAPDEFAEATRALIAAQERFATGIFLFWYPAKERPLVDASAGELLNAGIGALLKIELDIGALEPGTRLSATGLLVVNPPYGFADEMRSILPFLARILGQGPGAGGVVHSFAER
jgi:23S rRNA (adenine2030-N6)-methyltransferase